MNFQESIKTCLTKYADFTGRASKSEFWWFALACFIIISLLTPMLGRTVNGLVSLALFLPYLGVLVRRLHDTDRSGWWALLLLIPVLGTIVIIIFAILDGTPGPNRFGNPPQ